MSVQIQNTIDIPRAEREIFARVESALQWIGNDLVRRIKAYIDEHNINVDAQLKKSITAQVRRVLQEFTLQVGPNVYYAIYVHEGTRPHWAPLDPLRVWVVKKLNITGEEAEDVARRVQYKIARKGTEGRPFIEDVYTLYQPKIIPELIRRIGLT